MEPNTLNPCVSDAPQGRATPLADSITVVQLKTREEVLAAREAFEKGGLWRHAKFLDGDGVGAVDTAQYSRVAAEKYPMPKITVPREVKFDGLRYRFVNGRFERKSPSEYVWTASIAFNDAAGIKALAGLIDNPTCEVDA